MRSACRQKGLSLVEVLVITALAMLLAAALLPRLLRSRVSANEASAIASLDVIIKAQESYKAAYPALGYADSLSRLAMVCNQNDCQPSAEHACLIECRVAQATVAPSEGYVFHLNAGPAALGPHTSYVAAAVTAWAHRTGDHDYCAVEDKKVRWQAAAGPGRSEFPDHAGCQNWKVIP